MNTRTGNRRTERSSRLSAWFTSKRRRWVPLVAATGLLATALPFDATPALAIPTTHEITANWTTSPASVASGSTITGAWHINTNDSTSPESNELVDNVRLTLTATNGAFVSIPGVCKRTGVTPVSSISADDLTLTCNLGTVREGTSTIIETPVRVRGTATGDVLSASGTVTSDEATGISAPATQTPIPITFVRGMDLSLVQASATQGVNAASTAGGFRRMIQMNFSIIMRGTVPGPTNYSFPVTVSSSVAGTLAGLRYESCIPITVSATSTGQPYSDPSQADRTNFPGCSVSPATGTTYTVNLTGLTYTLVNNPTKDSLGQPLPGSGSYIASGTVRFGLGVAINALTTFTFTATPPAFAMADGGPTAADVAGNNTSSATLTGPGGYSVVWAGGPAGSRSPWDQNLWVSPGTSQGMRFVQSTDPNYVGTSRGFPLYMQANDGLWQTYTGAGGAGMAGSCLINQRPTVFLPTQADFGGTGDPDDGGGYGPVRTGHIYYTTTAVNAKTETCGQPVTGSIWRELIPPLNTAASPDPRVPGVALVDLPPGVTAIKVTWDPAIDNKLVYLRMFGYISPTAPTSGVGWTVGAYNTPGGGYVNLASANGGVPVPGDTYAAPTAGPNGLQDAFRLQGPYGEVTKAASDTSAQPGMPVTYTLKAKATNTVTSPPPVSFPVVDLLPVGMTYVPGSGTPTPSITTVSGQQQLTWTFASVPANVEQTITYQAQTAPGSTLAPGTNLTNIARIDVPGDQRNALARSAAATVTVPSASATTLGKSTPDSVLSFYGDTSSWLLAINSLDPVSNAFTDTIDILPYNGDGRGTDVDGAPAYTITSVTKPAGATTYYTTTPRASLSNDPRDDSNGTNPGSIVGATTVWSTTPVPNPTAIRVIGPALAPGALQTITINYSTPAGTSCATPAATDNKPGQQLVNSANSIAGHTGLPMLSSATTTIGDCYAMDIQKFVLSKGGDAAADSTDWHDADTSAEYQQYAAGDMAQYKLVVTNKGSATLTNITVSDPTFPDCARTIASLPAGESQDIFCEGQVGVGTTINTASATVTPPEGPPLNPQDPAGVVVPEPPVVQKVSNPADGGTANPGSVVTYTVTITEPASSAAPYPDAQIVDDLGDVLDAAEFVPGSITISPAGSGDAAFDTVAELLTWTADSPLMPGETVTLTYQVSVHDLADGLGDGVLFNTVRGGTCVSGLEPGCNTTILVPSYRIEKSSVPASPQSVRPGDRVDYTVNVINTGVVGYTPTITDDLADVLDNATYLGNAASSSGPSPVVAGTNLTWTGNLAVGQTVTLTYSVQVNDVDHLGDGVLDNFVGGTGPSNCPIGQPTPSECLTSHPVEALKITKTVSDAGTLVLGAGDDFTYTVTLTNVGQTTVTDASFSDDLHDVIDDATYQNDATVTSGPPGAFVYDSVPGLESLSWTMGVGETLAPGAAVVATYSVVVDNPSLGNQILLNAVLAPNTNCSLVPDPGCTTQVPQPVLTTLKAMSPSDPGPGDVVTYTITLSNTGTGPALNVPVKDDLSQALDDAVYNADAVATVGGVPAAAPVFTSPNLTWLGGIPNGQALVITYTMTVKGVEQLGDGHLLNTVFTPNCLLATDPGCTTEAGIPGYVIVKSSNPADGSNVRPGGFITYTVKITNTGGTAMTEAVTDDASDIFDDAILTTPATVIGGGPGTVTRVGDDFIWNGDHSASLPVDQSVSFSYTVQVNADGAGNTGNDTLHNTVTGTGDNNCVVADPDCDVTHPVESYKIVKSSTPPGPVQPGDTVDYSIEILNTGATALTPNVVDDLSDVLDDGDIGTVTTAPNLGTTTVDLTARTLTWTGPLAVGATITITYPVTVHAAADLGDETPGGVDGVMNNTVTGDGPSNCLPPDPADPACSTTTPIEAVRYEKSISNPNVLELQPGDAFTYTVIVANMGGTTLTDLTFTDDLAEVLDDTSDPTGITTNGPGSAHFDAPSQSLVWAMNPLTDQLLPGATVTVTYTVTIDDPIDPLVSDGKMTNAVIGTGPDSNCLTGDEPECHTVTPAPVLSTTKAVASASPSPARAGGTVTYTITVTNTGEGAALDVPIRDDLSDVLDDATYVTGSATLDGNPAAAPTFSPALQQLSWNGDIPNGGAGLVITYTVLVDSIDNLADGDGSLDNHVTAPGCAPQECETVTPIPAYTIVKASDPTEGTTIAPGSDVTYTVTITNVGGTDIVGETVTDDASNVFDDADLTTGPTVTSGPGTATRSGDDIVWNATGAAILPIDGVVVITYTVTIRDADDLGDAATGGGTLGNVVTGETPDITNCPVPADGASGNPVCETQHPIEAYELSKLSDPAPGETVYPGDTVTYTVVVHNTGGIAITPVITDDLTNVLDDATYVPGSAGASLGAAPTVTGVLMTWTDPANPIAPDQTVELTYQVTINDEDALGDFELDNVVTGTGNTNCPTGSAEDECVTNHPVGAWDVVKTADTNVVVPGAVITYTVTVANVGHADLDGLEFDDGLTAVLDAAAYRADAQATIGTVSYTAPTLHWEGDLAVGETSSITYSVTVSNPLSGDGELYNAVVTPPDIPGSPCPEAPLDPECDVQLPGRELTLAKDTVPADISSVEPGDTVHYRVVATNTGADPYLPATVVDDLADALDAAHGPTNIVVTGPGTATFDGISKLTWSGPLQPDEAVVIEYDLVVNAPLTADGWLENSATSPDEGANCPTADFASTPTDCKTATPVRSMHVVKSSDPAPGATVAPGDLISYTITVSNTGQAALTPASLTDDLTGVLDDATMEGAPAASSGTVSVSGAALTWSGDLAIGASATITYRMLLVAGGDGQLRNVVTSDGPASNCPTGDAGTECVTNAVVVQPPPPPTTTTPPPPTTPSTTPPTVPDPGELPATGSDSNSLLRAVLLLALTGGGLILISRRRKRPANRVRTPG